VADDESSNKRVRVVRAMVMVMRVVGGKEGRGSKGNGVSDEGGVWHAMKRAMAMVARVMPTRVAGECH
jgi:hypothetical protein